MSAENTERIARCVAQARSSDVRLDLDALGGQTFAVAVEDCARDRVELAGIGGT